MGRVLHRARSLHRDERGTISMLTLIILFAFTMILGMMINVGRQVDDKIRLQNAVDAGTYSSGVVLARGMNSIAFTNHLLCEVCAMTAYLREGRDRSSEKMVPDVLAAWKKLGPIFAKSQFEKFARLGPAITGKVPLEQELVDSFSEMTAIKSKIMLPALEYILGEPETKGGSPQSHLIPQFQRAVVQAVPPIAQYTMSEIAGRHGPAQPAGGGGGGQGGAGSGQTSTRTRPLSAAIWRSTVVPIGASDEDDPYLRTLPAVDPSQTGTDADGLTAGDLQVLQTESRETRRQLAHHYLEQWIGDRNWDMGPFEREYRDEGGRVYGKMSQFANIWRIFSCAQLEKLLTEEFPNTNLPHMLRRTAIPPQQPYSHPLRIGEIPTDYTPSRTVLDSDFSWVGVVYWPQLSQTFPGMFKHPIQGNAVTFAEVQLYIPLRRYRCCPWAWPYLRTIQNPDGTTTTVTEWVDNFDNWPSEWNLFNQNWSSRLTPATHPQLAAILRTPPGQLGPQVQLPNMQNLNSNAINSINTH